MKLSQLFNNQLPELIMYDLDGTLVDSVPDLAIAVQKMQQDLSLPVADTQTITLWVGNGIPTLIKRSLANDMSGDEPNIIEPSLFAKAQTCFNHHYSQELGLHSRLYDGVLPFLQAMADQQVKQAIITNKTAVFTEKLLKIMAIDSFFELCIGGDTLAEKKPHPLPLQHTIKQLNSRRSNSLMIGDSSNDVNAAKAAGVKVAGLTYGYNHGEPISASDPDIILSSLTELL